MSMNIRNEMMMQHLRTQTEDSVSILSYRAMTRMSDADHINLLVELLKEMIDELYVKRNYSRVA